MPEEKYYALYGEDSSKPVGTLRTSTLSAIPELERGLGIKLSTSEITSEEAERIRERLTK